MDDQGVRDGQGAQSLANSASRLGIVSSSVPRWSRSHCFQVMAFDQVHDDADAALAFIKIVDRADVGMAQAARDQDFTAQRFDIAAVVLVRSA